MLEKLLARLRKRYGPEVIIRGLLRTYSVRGFTIARRLRRLGVESAMNKSPVEIAKSTKPHF